MAEEPNKNSSNDPRHKLLLSLSCAHKTGKGNEAITASLSTLLDQDCGPETEEDEVALHLMFALLHEPLIKSHAKIWKQNHFPRMTPSEFCNHMIHEDDSLPLKLMCALGTGQITLPMKQIVCDGSTFSRFMACGIAKEMIQRLEIEKPGPLQWMMGDVLSIVNAPKATRDFLSKVRVAAHRTTIDQRSTEKATSSALHKINLDPLDGFSIHFDNAGFKGREKKWSQHTVIQMCVIKYEDLLNAGFHRGLLSRERKTFDDLLEETELKIGQQEFSKAARETARTVVGIQKSDWEKLSTRVLTTIEKAIELDLPDSETCKELMSLGEGFGNCCVPMNLGNAIETLPKVVGEKEGGKTVVASIAVNHAIPSTSLSDGKTETREADDETRKTFCEVNNMTLDNALHEDPNATKTVRNIADYLERLLITRKTVMPSRAAESFLCVTC